MPLVLERDAILQGGDFGPEFGRVLSSPKHPKTKMMASMK
jgi:hypothetical protein